MAMSPYDPIDIERSRADSRSLIMPHQQEAVDALTAYFRPDEELAGRSGVLVMPTGSGKTYTAVTWLLKEGVARGYRVVWLVHRQELVNQAFNEFVKQAPLLKGSGKARLRVLAVSGAHLHMSSANRADVYVCSIASMANRYGYRFIERMLGVPGKRRLIVVVDEAHHAVAANYQRALKRMQALSPHMLLLGLTATPIRMNAYEQQRLIRLFRVDHNLRHGIGRRGFVYEVTLKQLLMSGFLAKPVYEPVQTQIVGEIAYELSAEDEAYFKRFGELSERLRAQIARSSARNQLILEQYLAHRQRYGKTLIFAVNQLHAETLCQAFLEAGISCDYAVSGRPDAQQVIQRFKDSQFQVLVNVQMMTEGSDVPDIQTVFLTRQTNSESLLMQMIGRGLRGPSAGGTAEAYIVAFHDTWQSFASWMDPVALDVFQVEDSEEEAEALQVLPEIAPRAEEEQPAPSAAKPPEGWETAAVTLRDLYLTLYASMRASIRADAGAFAFPVGWYSLVDAEGEALSLLVFEDQLAGYQRIGQGIDLLLTKGVGADYLAACLQDASLQPDSELLACFAENIRDTGEMPPYFSFAQRERYDPLAIGLDVQQRYEKEEEQVEHLKALFDHTPILQQVYKYFFAFKKTVYDALKERRDEEIHRLDEREQYEIVDNHFPLETLLLEVLEMYPALRSDQLTGISWSKRVMKSWFAQCRRDKTQQYYYIQVNRLLSSPRMEREVVKYLIFHELLHANGYWYHGEDFRSLEWQYPDAARLDSILDSLRLRYHILPEQPPAKAEPVSAPAFKANAPGVRSGYKYCRNCANLLPEAAKFCDRCGSNTQYA